ncbi:MAG: S8 family serine peptidase [Flavobacteriales bacterium]|nr:S8 family serine peptidase [Flavobacteriales bacterium]
MEGKGFKKTFRLRSGYTLFFALFFLLTASFSSNHPPSKKYWVFFTDKKGVTFDPYSYFTPQAIARRISAGLPVCDSTDYPVSPVYLDVVSTYADSSCMVLRWFNAVVIWANEDDAQTILQLPFVSEVRLVSTDASVMAGTQEQQVLSAAQKIALLKFQVNRMQGERFAKAGFTGKGLRIAILDAGFPGVNIRPEFKHIRDRNGIIATYDFVRKREDVYHYSPHGSMVLSCIGGISDTIPIGMATGADFLLARTESVMHERFSEEENWLAAVEWADRNGANILNSSLGYTSQRYFPEDMDGQTSLIARAANMAAAKGILVVSAAGNEGKSQWRHITSPGDADSALSVGAVNPYADLRSDFSSYGPTADGRAKPNVSALGTVMAAGPDGLEETSGTSFASPLVAGFAACVWEGNSNLTNMQLHEKIQQSGHLYPYYDYAHGYGIPQASYFTETNVPVASPTFEFADSVSKFISVHIDHRFFEPDTIITSAGEDRDTIIQDKPMKGKWNLYYHITDTTGRIRYYSVIRVREAEPLTLGLFRFQPGESLSVHFEGYTRTYLFK